MRIIIASSLVFVGLMLIWGHIIDTGYEKMKPVLDEQKKRAQEQQELLAKYVQGELEDIGFAAFDSVFDFNHGMPEKSEYSHFQAPLMRPVGTWIGVREDHGKKIAILKFDRSNYWLVVKDGAGEDIKESGSYEYQYTQIRFKSNQGSQYWMDYTMYSKDAIELAGGNRSYMLEKTTGLKVDFD